jgi:hypothetical protein
MPQSQVRELKFEPTNASRNMPVASYYSRWVPQSIAAL